ncbi:MAG: hypothetical protein ACFFB0_07400 [Promethearchaeota archaeon]
MVNKDRKTIFKNKTRKTIVIAFILSMILLFDSSLINLKTQFNDYSCEDNDDVEFYSENLKTANEEEILFQGTELPLNITDTGTLYKFNQEVSVTNQEELNLTYYLDEEHDWKVSRIETSINNIQDSREWINNSGFINNVTVYSKDVDLHNIDPPGNPPHNYADDLDEDPTNPANIHSKIYQNDALAIRVHFDTMEFEPVWDCVFIWNKFDKCCFCDTGFKYDFFTPWILGNGINITIGSDDWLGSNEYGYYIDRYEYVNASSGFLDNFVNWGNNTNDDTHNYGSGWIGKNTAMYTALYSKPDRTDHSDYFTADYTKGNYSEIYQNLTIPRGNVIDADISFAYYAEFAMESNDNLIYFAINNKKVYTLGLREVVEAGRYQWHHTGKINLDLWVNTSKIFNNPVNDQKINISVGIMSGASVSYSGFQDAYQQVIWFDNVSLSITAIANSTQEGINLTTKANSTQKNLISGPNWGMGTLNFDGIWDTYPIILTFNTTSPQLDFKLNTTLYGYHETISKINQLNAQGITYKILKNSTIYWEFYHNFYMPPQYTDFEFEIIKPSNWEFLSVLDPTLQSRSFEGGEIGNTVLKVNKTNAVFPGWWKFTANSPNYLNLSNTKMSKDGLWGVNTFYSGDTTRIRTQVNYSNEIPPNVNLTSLSLKIYYPNGTLWYQESKNPYSNGTVIFSSLFFTPEDFIGGQYNYTIFWSNGTALGGLNSSFILMHNSSLTLLKPEDAKPDLRTEGFVGDLIPIRVLLKDCENNLTISNAIVSYNWTDGTRYFEESAPGFYETLIYTSDLSSHGLYNIVVHSSKIGFLESNFTLEINLGEKTNLQVLESEYNIELHDNSTIKFKFTDFEGGGIDGADVNVSIPNKSLYSVNNTGNGEYNIEFSTLFINEVGIYELSINFSAVAYEPQNYIYQFQITKQSVELFANLNSQDVSENSVYNTTFNDEIEISARAMSMIDKEYLTEGVITFISGDYRKSLTESGSYWFNTSILCSPEYFSIGINYIYLEFQDPNYKISTFGFQLLVEQIEISVDPIGFRDTINAEIGETLNIQIQLLDPKTNISIEDATVSFSWDHGIGTINETSPGIYQTYIKLPNDLEGNFKFNLLIISNSTTYKTTQYSFIVVIEKPVGGGGLPNYLLWIIIGVLVSIVSALGILSLRSYVLLPRRRRKESELMARTQRFKDLKNIQAIVIIHRLSGIPLYSKSYSILEKHKKELFSGFIQAITTIGEEFSEKEVYKQKIAQIKEKTKTESIIELDFKYFHCVIADKEDIRAVFILEEKSSVRLKEQISLLMLALNLKLTNEIENWDGSLDEFEKRIPSILTDYFELFYKEAFKLTDDINLIKLKKEKTLTKMEIRVLNVVQSMSKRDIRLNDIVEVVSEENKDLVIEAIETLIKQEIVVPIN